jgi:hypothetical protein
MESIPVELSPIAPPVEPRSSDLPMAADYKAKIQVQVPTLIP